MENNLFIFTFFHHLARQKMCVVNHTIGIKISAKNNDSALKKKFFLHIDVDNLNFNKLNEYIFGSNEMIYD